MTRLVQVFGDQHTTPELTIVFLNEQVQQKRDHQCVNKQAVCGEYTLIGQVLYFLYLN